MRQCLWACACKRDIKVHTANSRSSHRIPESIGWRSTRSTVHSVLTGLFTIWETFYPKQLRGTWAHRSLAWIGQVQLWTGSIFFLGICWHNVCQKTWCFGSDCHRFDETICQCSYSSSSSAVWCLDSYLKTVYCGPRDTCFQSFDDWGPSTLLHWYACPQKP